VLVNLAIFFTIWQFSKTGLAVKKLSNKTDNINKDWRLCLSGMILPSMMSTAVAVYTILLSNRFIIQLLFILNIILLYFYLRCIYYYLARPAAYKQFSIENISSYCNFLIFFLVAAAVYGMQSFLNIQIWLLMIIILVTAGLIVYQILWANKIELSKGIIYILISCLILAELSWSISFLPLNHYVAGLTLALCYYMLIGLIRYYLLDALNGRRIKLYLCVGFIGLFIVLVTARWM
ncbi:MAG: hypothetical protein U9R14_02275, partial [Patescibacteria group bacterium]|nr:hypothetical protein [Patescibacteria group bacterium]